MFVSGLACTLTALAIPTFGHAVDNYRARSAVRYMASRLQRARAEAVMRGGNVALRFGEEADRISFAAFADGNGNGVSSADIAAGIDPQVSPSSDLSEFTGVRFGIVPGIPSPEDVPLRGDPIRFGGSRMASFSPHGTATAGSVYIRGREGSQYVVRVYGDTGKSTVLRFDRSRRRWVRL